MKVLFIDLIILLSDCELIVLLLHVLNDNLYVGAHLLVCYVYMGSLVLTLTVNTAVGGANAPASLGTSDRLGRFGGLQLFEDRATQLQHFTLG